MQKCFVVLSLLVLAVATSSFAGNISPVSSTTSLTAIAVAKGTQNQTQNMMSQGASVNALFSSVLANAANGGTNSTATANVFAQWNSFDPSQGVVTFSNVGWSITAGPNCNFNCGADLSTGGPDYQYTFTSGIIQYFNLNYDVFASTLQTFGLNGFSVCFNSNCSNYGLNSSGTATFLVVPGITYNLDIKNLANISIQGAGIFNEEMNAQYLFFTSPTPEPSSLLLMGTGLVGLIGTLRLKFRH